MINLVHTFTQAETSAFSKAIFNPRSGNMQLTYRTGNAYIIKSLIKDVDCKGLYSDIIGAESKGRFFNQYIKHNSNYIVVPKQ